MYKRDLITAEIQKLADVLSKILKFKLDGDLEEASLLFDQTLESEFGLDAEALSDELTVFKSAVEEQQYSAEKLDMLSQFIYCRLHDHDAYGYTQSIANKLLVLYDILEKQHRIISLENLNRQSFLSQYL